MIKKNYGRKVFLIEVSLNNKVLGYYAGKDRDYRIIVKGIDDAMMFKNEKSVRHNVAHQERYNKNDNSFKSSLNFEKAILFGEYRINKMLYHLSRKYAEKYVFFFDRLFVVENRDIKIIGNIN